jgi:amino acid adenylation domain-containing protein
MSSSLAPASPGTISGHTVPALFEAQVSRTPDEIALIHDGREVTYAELDERANQLAHFLIRLGAGPGQLVAVLLGRSTDLVIALLAVLKSGAGYVPLSVDDPRDRLNYILADAGTSVVITSIDDQVLACPRTPPDDSARRSPLRGDGIAYVIYTSGSTGRPKGVAIEHNALVSYLGHCRSHYPSLAGRALLHSSVSFDMAVTSLYGPLVSGGTVVLADLNELASAGSPPRWFRQPTFLKVTPSHLPLLQVLPAACSPGEQLVIGGEALTSGALDAWRQSHPGVTVINEYGPTEAAVGCCTYVVRAGQVLGPGHVPIGKPTQGTQLYVLGESGRPLPDGETGELYIAGDQLARGYLHQPALTAKRFLKNPFGPAGSRMYRTGDLVRVRDDGELEFLGRIDDQVKISGYRVEPGEIEAAIASCNGVAQCAAAIREMATSAPAGQDKQIIAYLVPTAGTRLDIPAVRCHAAGILPPYMIPSAFVPLTELPLTANGKLDRSRLPAATPSGSRDITAAQTPQEVLLCQLFREVTGVERAGIDDDFMALGGSSIGAARLVSRARKAGLEIGLMDILRKRTVREILASYGGTNNENRTRDSAAAR